MQFTDFHFLMHRKELLVKRKLRRLKFTDLEINEANDRDNISNINLTTIVAVKIKNNNKQIYY